MDTLDRYYIRSYTHTALLGLLIQARVIDIARLPGQNPEWLVYPARPYGRIFSPVMTNF